MRKLLINLVMLILAFTIQICVFPQIAFLSSAPNLLLIVVFVCSFIEGRERGMFYGLVAGLFMDLFYSGPFGFYTLFFIRSSRSGAEMSDGYFPSESSISSTFLRP